MSVLKEGKPMSTELCQDMIVTFDGVLFVVNRQDINVLIYNIAGIKAKTRVISIFIEIEMRDGSVTKFIVPNKPVYRARYKTILGKMDKYAARFETDEAIKPWLKYVLGYSL